jgi:hypothetical protein
MKPAAAGALIEARSAPPIDTTTIATTAAATLPPIEADSDATPTEW